MRLSLLIILLVLCAPLGSVAREVGTGQTTAVVKGLPIRVFTYHPRNCAPRALLFVFHGNGRTAERYRNYARPLADRMCLVVMAPLFDKKRFRNWRYQRGGIVRKGRVRPADEWTVTMVAGLVDWARRREGRADAPFYLFGHSAGGQFLSRVAAFAAPAGVARIVIANPSSHVAPSLDEPAPYGMGGVFRNGESESRLRAYLGQPVTIFLGEDDTGSKDLHNHPAARRQGAQRLARGENVFRAAAALARGKGWPFRWSLVKARDVGHSARRLLKAPETLQAFGWTGSESLR